jgi:type III secretion protein S
MGSQGIVQELYTAFMAGMVLSAPPVVAAVVIGLLLAIIQAATQIQDQSLPQLIKIVVIALVVIFFGVPLSNPLFEHTRTLFASFHNMTR